MASNILEILITPITELAKLFVVPLQHHVGYLVKFNKNVTHLIGNSKELEITRDSAKSNMDEARRRGETSTQDMKQWLEKAERIMIDVHRLLSELEDVEMNNSNRCCTTLHKRYASSKKAIKLLKAINYLKDSIKQIPVSRPAPPPSIEMMPMGEFEAFETTRVAFGEIMEALKHDDNRVIGVYGMGGVGKTSLIKEVAKSTKIMNLFDEVVIATVSRNPDMKKIQREIAEGFGLQLMEETEHLRSLRLAERLKHESRKLIILDDVWERLDLSQVGISSGNGKDTGNCKIAITTRNLDVCSEMYCNKSIMIDPLSEQDSWDLFKKVVGDVVDSPEINSSANEVVRECGGLPIALVTLGRVLRNKEPRYWDDAAYELRQSRPLNIKGMHEKVFSCLKLSFDEIQNEESQMFFLYCALFPEDYDVQIEGLLRYGIGERLFSDVTTLDQARNRVHSIISNLKASCLLLSNSNQECVKMHDVFRDLAISIATTDDYSFMVKASSGLKQWPSNLKLQYVMRMSLINNEFSMFNGQGEYPELTLLLLQNNKSLKAIPANFFVGMKALQVLDLSNIPDLVALPTSLSSLTNLRTLCVDNNNLDDTSALRELKSIEILSMRKTSFVRFPEEIRRLTNLRLLDLSDSQVVEVPTKVFSSLLHLEELYMGGCYNAWEMNETKGSEKATLAEVLALECMNTLHIDIGNHAFLTEERTNQQLKIKKFQIHIGERLGFPPTNYATSMCFNITDYYGVPEPLMNRLKSFLQTTMQLSILNWKALSSLDEFQPDCFQLLKHLHIEKCDFQTCFSSTLFRRFQGLQELHIWSCCKLDTVFLSNDRVPQSNVLPRLTNMHVKDAPNLTALWRGVAPFTSFQSLKHMKVELCTQIKVLFPLAIAKVLNQLQYLDISYCDAMEALIYNFGAHEDQTDSWSGQPNVTNRGAESTNLHSQTLFPQLQSLKLSHLKNIKCLIQPRDLRDFPSLEQLTVLGCPVLKLRPGPNSLHKLIQIQAERQWFEKMEYEDGKTKRSWQLCFTEVSI